MMLSGATQVDQDDQTGSNGENETQFTSVMSFKSILLPKSLVLPSSGLLFPLLQVLRSADVEVARGRGRDVELRHGGWAPRGHPWQLTHEHHEKGNNKARTMPRMITAQTARSWPDRREHNEGS